MRDLQHDFRTFLTMVGVGAALGLLLKMSDHIDQILQLLKAR